MDSWLVVLPPLLAIVLAILSREVYLSLFAGLWLGTTFLADFNPLLGLQGAIDALVGVFASPGNTRVVLFSVGVGALVALTQRSGGVDGFVAWMRNRHWGESRRSAGLVAWFTGVLVFVESSVTCLVVGAVARPLTDQAKLSREKLAFLADSTSAPICVLIPLNAWGAFVMGLLAEQGISSPLTLLLWAIPLNFYALAALGISFWSAFSDRDFGPMRKAQERARDRGELIAPGATPMVSEEVSSLPSKEGVTPRARLLLLPIAAMIAMMPLGLWLTGRQALQAQGQSSASLMDLLGAGSGSTSVLWAVLAGLAVVSALSLWHRIFRLRELFGVAIKGAGGLMPMAVIMVLAFAINSMCGQLGTGPWIAQATSSVLSAEVLPVLVFVIACVISFATGTSWGTFGIMMPIALPLAFAMDANLGLTVAAVLGGGVFGDHCSPISDTTAVSCLATACDLVDHVRTQLPYALAAGALASIAYLVAGFLFS